MTAPAPETFPAQLQVALKLTIDGKVHDIAGSMVRDFRCDLHPWGYEAEVSFWQALRGGADDPVLTDFVTPKLMAVDFSVKEDAKTPVNKVILKGLATEKGLSEVFSANVADKSVLFRLYRVRFADPAQVLWRQHFPCDLHVGKNLAAVIDAHKGEKITISYDWPATQTVYPIHFLALGFDGHEASFYDFVVWFAHRWDGVFTYDSATNAYKLATAKDASGTAQKLPHATVARHEVLFPETARHLPRVLNSYATSPTTEETANAQKVAGVRQDHLVRTSIASQASDRKTLETNRLVLREPEVRVTFGGYPNTSLLPGAIVNFAHESFGTKIFEATKDYRVRELRLRGAAPNQGPTTGDAFLARSYHTELSVELELKAETFVPLPPHREPHWPVPVEGLVLSETGAENRETYQIYKDANTSVDEYKVKVPLFKANGQPLIVVAPYEPNTLPGHFYFPAIKDARVLLAMGFRSATIDRFLAWRPGARIPVDGQGNHLLLGWTSQKSQTSIKHDYVDQKPVLTVNRIEEKDTELLELKDGTIVIQTKEEA